VPLLRAPLLLGLIALLSITCRSVAAPPAVPDSSPDLSLRILVELRLDGSPAIPERLRAKRSALEAALASADIPYEVVRTYETIPWVVLRIRPEDRAAVAGLPEVGAVRDDSVERIQEKAGS
jgi:hypothetical protein